MADLEPCRASKMELCKKLHLQAMTHSRNRTVVNSLKLRKTTHLTFHILSNLTEKRNFYLNICLCLFLKMVSYI